jgi:hypothetical protein
MSSLTNLVIADGVIGASDANRTDVLAVQVALSQAGYRVAIDGLFGPGTMAAVRTFQQQHRLNVSGAVDRATAAMLDLPHAALVTHAEPMMVRSQAQGARAVDMPHDDTASLLAFYGRPWGDSSLLTQVLVPPELKMEYAGTRVVHITFHKRVAGYLAAALDQIARASLTNPAVLKHVSHFSGSYNYRPVRGSSRLSCHAFGAAIDFDAAHLPLGKTGISEADMPREMVAAFKGQGAFWGGEYKGRKDAMHFQWAHE